MKDERIERIKKYLIQSCNKNDIDILNQTLTSNELNVLIEEVIALNDKNNTSYLTDKLLDIIPDAIIGVNANSEITVLNEKAILLFGYQKKELIGKQLSKLIPERYSSVHSKYTSNYMSKPSARRMSERKHDFFGLRKDGLEFPVDINLSHLESPNGKIVLASIRDISKQKETENKFKISSNQFEKLFELSPDAIFIHDTTYITHVNRAFLQLFGYDSKADIIGKPSLETISDPESLDLIQTAREEVKKKGVSFLPLVKYKRKNGESFSTESNASLIEINEKPHVQVIVRDISVRLKLKNEIIKSEAKFRGVFDSMMDLFIRVNEQGVVDMVSPSVTRLLGYSQADVIGRYVGEFYKNTKDTDAFLKLIEANGFCEGFEAELINKAGEAKIFSINARVYTNESNELNAIESISRDITKQKNVERRNHAINTIANKLSSKISIEHFCLDVFNEIQNVKPIFNMCVLTYDDIANEASVFFKIENSKLIKDLPKTRKNGNGLSEYVVKTKKGLLLSGDELASFHEENKLEIYGALAESWLGVPLVSEGKVEGVLVVESFDSKDVYTEEDFNFLSFIGTQIGSLVERDRYAKEIEQFEKYFSVSMDLFCIANLSGYFTKVNPKFSETLGYTEKELLSRSFIEFIHPDDIDITAIQMEKLSNGVRTVNFTNRYRCKDGVYKWLLWTSTPDPELNLIYAAAKDVTKEKEAQLIKENFTKKLELKVAERTSDLESSQEKLKLSLKKEQELGDLKTRFIATASHQFRTPLTVIQASINILDYQKNEMSDKLVPGFEKIHKRILEQVNRMTSLMDDVLILGKLNDRNFSVNFNPTDVVVLCSKTINNYNDIQTDNRIAEFSIVGTPVLLSLDEKLIEHAFSNMLSNAFKYSTGAANPEVKLTFESEKLQISIKDYGMGIPESDVDNLFEPFYRASNTLDISGTGLGTTVAKDYVELNNGVLLFNSELGEGTEFIMEFKMS